MRRMWKRLAAALALGLVLAACSGGDSASIEDTAGGLVEGSTQAPAPDDTVQAAGDAGSDGTAPVTDAAVPDRKVIRTGEMTLWASDTRATLDRITSLVEASGGYVASSSIDPAGEGEQPRVTVTIRVPAGELSDALASIRDLADEVVSERTDSQDVTEEYTDVESRLRNLTALETELVALLSEVRQQPNADPQELLTVFNEISRVRGEIEVLEGRRRLLDDQAALSTITITVTAPPVEEPIVEEGWQPLLTARRAMGDLVETLQTFADGALWVLIYAVPVLALLGIPMWLLIRLANRRSRRQASPPPPPPAPAVPVGSGSHEPEDA